MMKHRLQNPIKIGLVFLVFAFASVSMSEVRGQRLNIEKIVGGLEKNDCLTIGAGKIKICKYDFDFKAKTIEALTIRPAAEGKFPSLLLLPGFNLTAKDLISYGVLYAHEGFASIVVTPPGFGKSAGKADFVGLETRATFAAGWDRFRREPFVDAEKMGVYGHSRGGMAASFLALELPGAKAAVFASGIYDLKRALADIPVLGIRKKIVEETGATEQALEERSSIRRMQELNIPVLILHGDGDEKTPVNQAFLLRDALIALKKDFELKIFAGAAHALDEKEVIPLTADFFRRRMNLVPES